MKKNKAQEIQKRIDDLKTQKENELNEIFQKAQEAGIASETAENDMKAATEALDLKAFEAAKKAKETADNAAEMYGRRYAQLEAREFVTEQESDAVIDGLLQYEEELADEFRKATAAPIGELKRLHDEYIAAVRETEDVIRLWTTEIHRNYRAEHTTYADGTNRSDTPVPVHHLPYDGCDEAHRIGSFLSRCSGSETMTKAED